MQGKCHGGNKKVAFLVGTAYGRGWVSNFGPLEDEESDYQIFEGEDSEDEDEDDDEEDDDDEEEDDDLFHLIQVTKNGEGIKDIELEEGKKARKRFKRKQNKGRVCILVKGGKVKKYVKGGAAATAAGTTAPAAGPRRCCARHDCAPATPTLLLLLLLLLPTYSPRPFSGTRTRRGSETLARTWPRSNSAS